MANAPVQVILNVDNFRRDRETRPPGSAGKDFFQGRNDAFAAHKQRLKEQVQAIRGRLTASSANDNAEGMVYIKVSLQQDALAKSHRPTHVLFTEKRAPVRGSTRLGEIISEVSVPALESLSAAIEKAEIAVRTKLRKVKDVEEEVPTPTRYRCEVGAIESIDLWSKGDRRSFSVSDAVRWLSDPRTGCAYAVQLFDMPPAPSQWDALPAGKRALFTSFVDGLRSLGPGLVVRVPQGLSKHSAQVEIMLTSDHEPAALFVPSRREQGTKRDFDSSEVRHRLLIGFLENHPLVRHIALPSILIRSATQGMPVGAPIAPLIRDAKASYPAVGVIDGGVSRVFDPWIVTRVGFLATEHERLDHGSFISGLLVEGSSHNPDLNIGKDGCLIADINLFPDDKQPGVFEQYYPNGISDFLDEVAVAVANCRKQYDIRIFNLSLNVVNAVLLDRYSIEAQRLDKIAEENDVIFVISAGNLDVKTQRLEWPTDDAQAAAILAAHRDDQLFIPAESIRNLSVAAINPDGLTNCIAKAPTRYTRRGPGLKTGVKPDLCHVGGSGTKCPTKSHGLFSRAPNGAITSDCGTSYAAPLVARTLAGLAAEIEGTVSRETLIALAVHHAQIPPPLRKRVFGPLARQLAGFGYPSASSDALAGGDHEITLLFSSRISPGKMLEFAFVWPPSLVLPGGKCRGDVRLTLVSTPPLDYRFGEEFVRVNLEAALQQEKGNGKFESALEPTYVFFSDEEKVREAHLIEHAFKWSPVKSFAKRMPKGRGVSSNWRLVVNYLTRDGENLPPDGTPFSILLTIADPDNVKPVFQEMRQSLVASGTKTADIRTATRVTPRV